MSANPTETRKGMLDLVKSWAMNPKIAALREEGKIALPEVPLLPMSVTAYLTGERSKLDVNLILTPRKNETCRIHHAATRIDLSRSNDELISMVLNAQSDWVVLRSSSPQISIRRSSLRKALLAFGMIDPPEPKKKSCK